MLHLLFGAALLVAPLSHDTATSRSIISSPTVVETPVTKVRSYITADSIVVEKHKRRLTLYQLGIPVRTYAIALGKQPVGDKLQIGDNRTPEGLFYIDYKNPDSKYHMALHISYPDAAHIAKSHAAHEKPGGDIMIHGLPDAYASLGEKHAAYDWTEGCIAVTNIQIDEIWRAVPRGSPILIKP
ncbi:MAG: L,D-transpeptidase family protein [Gemmatimonadaceae bacterium]